MKVSAGLPRSSISPATDSWQYSATVALVAVAGVRIFLTVYMVAISHLVPVPELKEFYAHTQVPLLQSGWEGALLGVWQREDALWYEKIATVGYSTQDMTGQLFPLYPLLMRGVIMATGMHPVAAGIAVSEISLFGAFLLLHRLILPLFGKGVANRSVAYLALYPSAFFLHAPFTESLMLFLMILAIYLVSRGRWVEAAAVGYLAGLTRPQGMLLGPALALHSIAGDRMAGDWRLFDWRPSKLVRAAALVLGPLLGFATFALFVEGPWRMPGFQGGVGPMGRQSLALPGAALLNATQQILAGKAHGIDISDFLQALVFLGLTVLCFRKLSAGYAVCALLFLLAPLSRIMPTFPLMSFFRFALLLFPCFIVLAIWGRSRLVHLTVIFMWITGLVLWSLIFYTGAFVA